MTIEKSEPTLTMTLNKRELKWLKDISQNSEPSEQEEQSKIRLSFFVASARALGYAINDDGSATRSISGQFQGD